MKRVDRLIIKAKRSVRTELVYALVERAGELWKALVYLSRRRQGSGLEIRESLHPTMEEAVDRINAVASEYPNSQDLPILIDDLPG